jgi:hypothetical protein
MKGQMCHKVCQQLQSIHIGVWLMQKFIRPRILGSETWG